MYNAAIVAYNGWLNDKRPIRFRSVIHSLAFTTYSIGMKWQSWDIRIDVCGLGLGIINDSIENRPVYVHIALSTVTIGYGTIQICIWAWWGMMLWHLLVCESADILSESTFIFSNWSFSSFCFNKFKQAKWTDTSCGWLALFQINSSIEPSWFDCGPWNTPGDYLHTPLGTRRLFFVPSLWHLSWPHASVILYIHTRHESEHT